MLLDCKRLRTGFKGTALENSCDLLCRLDSYHLLFKTPIGEDYKTVKHFEYTPDVYKKWCKFCAGGDLQVCELLGKNGLDNETGLRYGTYDEYGEESKDAGLPQEYFVFAVANFGDYFCFRKSDGDTKDEKVYQWGIHEGQVVLIWDSFADWLSEWVYTWANMVADDELDPIDYKLEDHDEPDSAGLKSEGGNE